MIERLGSLGVDFVIISQSLSQLSPLIKVTAVSSIDNEI